MIRVANVIEDGRVAGPQLRILAIARALQADGVETTVIHPAYQSAQFAQKLDAAQIPHKALPLHRLNRSIAGILSYLFWFPIEIFLLTRLFRREAYDFVHCSGGFWQVKGLIAARLAGRKALWHMNDTILPKLLRGPFRAAAGGFAHRLIFAGARVREHYLDGTAPPVPAIEIQAPVDCRRFDPSSAVPDARLMAEPGPKVVTVSNLNPLKGIEYFIDMAGLLAGKHPDVRFYIVGPALDSQDAYLRRLRAQIERLELRTVHFYGRTDDVPGVLAASDVFVCSSIAEASPTSVWEAMAMGKAVVSSDVGEVSRFIHNGEGGFVVPVADAGGMAQAVDRFLNDPELRRACGAAARQVALAELDLPVAAAAHQRAYR